MGTGATKRITDDEVKEVLKINDDALQSIGFGNKQGKSWNDFFYGSGNLGRKIDIDNYISSDGTKFILHEGERWVDITSRAVFSWPVLHYWGVLPTNKSIHEYLIALWQNTEQTGIHFYTMYNTDWCFNLIRYPYFNQITVKSLLPADYDSAEHWYTIKVNKCNTELWCDNSLLAIILYDLPEEIPTYSDKHPYAIRSACELMPGAMQIGLLFDNEGKPATIPFNFNKLTFYEGDPLPPRQYAIYTENSSTKWAGNTFDSTVTSHPIPVWGYPKKTFLFQSNAAGTIAIEVYAGGGWREVVSETVTANELWDYVLNLEVSIARMKYTPTNSDSITVAECNLS